MCGSAIGFRWMLIQISGTPLIGAVVRRFTAILAVDWLGVLNQSWNYYSPLVFSYVVPTKTQPPPTGKEYTVQDNPTDGPLREGYPCGPIGRS